ncbi:unnamed protein product [Penicillium salamii]|nr:unnamed protein product [Penicillium salamii]
MALLAMKLSICWICAIVVPVYAESPFVVQWSDKTYGPDGPWHAVSITLGSAKQAIDLYPGARWASTILIDTVCSDDLSTTCYAERGGVFDISASETAVPLNTPNDTSELSWLSDQTKAGVNVWGGVGHVKEGVLADELTLTNGFAVPNVSIASIYKANQTYGNNGKEYPVTLGTLSLGGTKGTHVVQGNTFNMVTAYMWDHTSAQQIPSYSWGMHIGSVEPEIPGSLVLGGYDRSRVLNEVSTQQVDPDSNLGNLKIYFEDIGIGVAAGDSPFDFESKSSLFKTGKSTTTRGATVEIDPVLPYLYLPRETCDAMAANLPITYNEDLNLYFWDTNNDTYQQITSSPAYMSFVFGKSTSNSQNMTIKVPFQLLKLTLQEPLVEKNTTYFPCYPSDTLILGRAFLQAAFISVNWQNATGGGEWSLAQAPGPAIGTGSQRSIGVNDESVEVSENSWEASWDGYWEPISSKASEEQSSSSSGLSTGAKVGIGIGCAAGGLGLIGMIAWLCMSRRKRQGNAQSPAMSQYTNIHTMSQDGTKSHGLSELNTVTLNELPSGKHAQEAPGSTTMRHELCMASSTAASNPAIPSLNLPPSQFARLQPHAYLLAHLSPPAASDQPSVRANGRTTSQFRVTSANAGSLTHTNGSAVVRIGDTAAVCGVRAELLHTEDIASWSVSTASEAEAGNTTQKGGSKTEDEEDRGHVQDLNLLVPNISLSTGCAPGFTPGAPPSTLAQSLSHEILSLLHTTRLVKADDLRIWYQPPNLESEEFRNAGEGMDVDSEQAGGPEPEIKAFWVLYIDIMIISLAGNPFDAAWASVLAALRDTKLPKAWWDADNETVLCSDNIADARKLSLRGLPVSSSFCTFEADAAAGWRSVVIPNADELKSQAQKQGSQQRWILADPDGYEEGLSQERVCVVVDIEDGKTVIVKMEKHGGWAVDSDDLRQLVDVSAKRWHEMKRILDQC